MEAALAGRRGVRAAVRGQRRGVRGSTHAFLNWHNLDYYTENYYSHNASSSVHDDESKGHYAVAPFYRWDNPLSAGLYANALIGTRIENSQVTVPYWINEHLFARSYWNTNLNLFYWKHFHLNFYYIERRRMPYKSVFNNQFVRTPRWAYNLVLMYTKNPYWDYVDVGLRTKTMLYLNSHIWLVFKFKMHKVARLNGIERGLKVMTFDHDEKVLNPFSHVLHGRMRSAKDLSHYTMGKTPSDHQQEGAGITRERNYAHVGTLAGPEFSREHTHQRPWWWHSMPQKRRRWDASNPFGHDLKQASDGVASQSLSVGGSNLSLNVRAMSSW